MLASPLRKRINIIIPVALSPISLISRAILLHPTSSEPGRSLLLFLHHFIPSLLLLRDTQDRDLPEILRREDSLLPLNLLTLLALSVLLLSLLLLGDAVALGLHLLCVGEAGTFLVAALEGREGEQPDLGGGLQFGAVLRWDGHAFAEKDVGVLSFEPALAVGPGEGAGEAADGALADVRLAHLEKASN